MDDDLARKVTELENQLKGVTRKQLEQTAEDRAKSDEKESSDELRETVMRLSRQNDELAKELGRLRLLEEQRAKADVVPPVTHSSSPPTTAPTTTPVTGRSDPGRPSYRCYYCGKAGHYAKECRKKMADDRQEETQRAAGATTTQNRPARARTYLRLRINGQLCKCLLDTGCDVTLLPTRMTAGVQLEPTTQRLLAANGTAIRVDGRATMEAAAGSQRLTISGLASPHVNEVMLGIDFLEQQRAIWNFEAGEIIIGGFHHSL